MKIMASVLLALGLSTTVLGAPVETAQLKTPRGAVVNVQVNVPTSLGSKTAAVVIAPGQGYNMDLPMIKEFAEKLAADGVLAFRFNYNYYSTDPVNGQPSDDLSNELQDMQTVIAYAKADSRVDAVLYDFLKDSHGNVTVDVVGGDHSWNVSSGTDPVSVQRNGDNVAAGVGMLAHWVDLFLGK